MKGIWLAQLILLGVTVLSVTGCGGSGGSGSATPGPGSSTDNVAPFVVSTNPPHTAVGSSLGTITASFSEGIDPASVTSASYSISGPGGPVPGTVTVSGSVVSFVASSPLTFGAGYEARISSTVRDMAANTMATDYVWRFNTGKQLAAGVAGYSTCARLIDGRVKCWGVNNYGQLGLGHSSTWGDQPNEMGASLLAVTLGTGRYAVQIVAGSHHVCARLDNLDVKCWGAATANGTGDQSGHGSGPNQMGDNLPRVELGTGRYAVELSAGDQHTCARLDNNRVKCWGDGIALGLGDSNDRGYFAFEMGDNLPHVDLGANRIASGIHAGWGRTCAALDDGTTKCWGYESAGGELGMGTTNTTRGITPQTVPANLPPLDIGTGRRVTAMGHGVQHVCAKLDDNTLKCWGTNGWGELGLGDTQTRGDQVNEMGDNLPVVNLGTGRAILDISTGGSRNCAILDNFHAKCWGFQGQPGLGYGATYVGHGIGDAVNETGDSLLAVNVGTNRTVREIAMGMFHVCAALSTGEIKCWGQNSSGQLGLGDTIDRGAQISDMGDNLPAVDLGR